MRVAVDKELCAGHAQCSALCPEVFDSDADGFAIVLGDGVVPPGAEEAAQAAIDACPERAISATSD